MRQIIIVGSGASGVHFALSVLRKGYRVTMLDVGLKKAQAVNPTDSFQELKANLADPAQYFLGENFDAVAYPADSDDYVTKYYGTPPSKNHVFNHPRSFAYEAKGMTPLISFAAGGLAEAWTGGAYPLNDRELAKFPFDYAEIGPHYGEVAKRIGLVGADDDLARFFPLHDNLLDPLILDEHSQMIVAGYQKRKGYINRKWGAYLGRSRVTTHSRDNGDRKGCSYCGRCLWGCPSESLYTPSITLRECQTFPNFEYIPGMLVSHFEYDESGHIMGIVANSLQTQETHHFQAKNYVLAAGTISSSKIVLESIFRRTGNVERLAGLMDNRQILVPFFSWRMLGKQANYETYQYHQLAIGIEPEGDGDYIHGQITTLKSASVHPIIQNLPFDMRTAAGIFRQVRAGLGVVNINLADKRRETNHLTIRVDSAGGPSKLLINYEPRQGEASEIERAIKVVKRVLLRMGCIVLPNMIHIRPIGASVHYTGTIPMSQANKRQTTTANCRSRDFPNLHIVDGTTFPALSAKNITFSLMANAARVAANEF